MTILPLGLVRGKSRFQGLLPQKQDEKWRYTKVGDMVMVLRWILHWYYLLLWQKKFGAPTPPYPWILGVEVWSVGQKSRFFDLRWESLGCCLVSKMFGAASYRVTWPGRKNLGVGSTFPASQKNFKLQNDGFQNDPQISFWPIGCRGCVGARQKYDQKNFRTWRCFLIPWSLHDDKNSSIYRKLDCCIFYFRAR